MESARRNSGNGFLDIFKRRETGLCHPRNYPRRALKTVIKHIDLYGELNGHEGPVNTLAFNSTGDLLISGSNDKKVMMWKWATNKRISSYPSGHSGNLLQAKFMPFTDDHKIITSATDGQVRLIELLDNGASQNKILSQELGNVNSLAVEPGNSYNFYSYGEEGYIKHYDLRSCSVTELFYCPTVHLKGFSSMVIDPRNPNYMALGGVDGFARVFDIRKIQVDPFTEEVTPVDVFCPRDYFPEIDKLSILSLAYSSTSELLVSYSDYTMCLFQRNMGYPSVDFFCSYVETSKSCPWDHEVYSVHRKWNTGKFKGVGFCGPADEYIVSGSNCGHIFIWEKKGGALVRSIVGDGLVVNKVLPHPLIPVLATCGSESNVKIWSPSSDKPVNQLDLGKRYRYLDYGNFDRSARPNLLIRGLRKSKRL